MLEKGKISAFQMAIMLYPTIVATAILSLPGITAKFAKNDLWISPIWASLTGFLTVFVANKLYKLYPKQTIVQYSKHIVGQIPGKILGLVYIFFYLQISGEIVRNYAEFVVGAFLDQTPIIVVISTMILVCAFTVRGGVEVIGRSAQVFVPILIFSFVFIIVLVSSDLKPQYLLPIMEHGMMPSILGAVVPQGWLGEFLLIAFLLPFLTDEEKGMKWGMISVVSVMITLTVTNLVLLFLFGGDIDSYLYPLMESARFISIANILENLQSIVMAMWVLGCFIKISVFYYAAVLGAAQWLNLSDYRPIIWPLGFLIVMFSFWGIPNFMALSHYNVIALPFYSFLIQALIPLFLLMIATLRKRMNRIHKTS